jgi:hypothetical protein
LGFLAVGVIAAFWASANRAEKLILQRQNKNLQVQVQLLETLVRNYEKQLDKGPEPDGATQSTKGKTTAPPAVETPAPSPAGTAATSVEPAASGNRQQDVDAAPQATATP